MLLVEIRVIAVDALAVFRMNLLHIFFKQILAPLFVISGKVTANGQSEWSGVSYGYIVI